MKYNVVAWAPDQDHTFYSSIVETCDTRELAFAALLKFYNNPSEHNQFFRKRTKPHHYRVETAECEHPVIDIAHNK